jgi:hypothetical protein
MLGNSQFYHRTIRKMVVIFGTMFNDLEIVRYTQAGVPKEKLKVPLSYGPKERYLSHITSDPNLIKSVNSVIPRMSFNLDSLEYDANRKQISTIQNFAGASSSTVNTQFLPVPYNFEFSLTIFVRNTEDGTQILEQILPFFTPDFSVVVDFIPSMNQKYTVPIILNSVASTVEYEGGMDDGTTRLILWDLTIHCKKASYGHLSKQAKLFMRQILISILILLQERFKKYMLITQTVIMCLLQEKHSVILQMDSLVQ